ncbi:MAG: hypothetical protein HC844_10730 [Tabrizicola sp.]|nr:hypothetical protein [Tabrizicola sp.]
MRSALLLALVLPACASLVPSTVTRLAALDPLSADPGDIAVSIILPPGLAVTPGSARLELAATRGDKTISGSYALMDRPAIPGATAAEGAEAVIYELTETDAARMRNFRPGSPAGRPRAMPGAASVLRSAVAPRAAGLRRMPVVRFSSGLPPMPPSCR